MTTGLDLRDQPLHIMYDVAYSFARQEALRTKEEREALEKVDRTIRAAHDDFTTGLPAFARKFGPADGS